MVFLEFHGVSISPLAVFAEIQEILNRFIYIWVSVTAFMPIHYVDSYASSLIFSTSISLLYS